MLRKSCSSILEFHRILLDLTKSWRMIIDIKNNIEPVMLVPTFTGVIK